jgi:hypothetical protein
MTYSKPNVAILGDAACVINGIVKGQGLSLDHSTGRRDFPPPAYDLDD